VNSRSIAQLDVYKGKDLVAELRRTQHGASFSYLPAYCAQHTGSAPAAVAFSLPLRTRPYEIVGSNLHPFFAGLLPEGLRFRALVRALKTSEDDLFSLLTTSGADTVGDISVAAAGETPKEYAPLADLPELGKVPFEQLLEESLRYAGGHADTTLAGMQPKLSAAMISFPLRARRKHRAYILKLTPKEYPKLAENEHFFMAAAKTCGFEVPRTALLHDVTGRSALLVERFDREAQADGSLLHLHQEDACQLLDRYPADKYRLSLAEIASGLSVCTAPIPECLKLLRMQALAYLVANGDLHAKNISVYVRAGHTQLTPVYDFVSTLPYGDRSMALAMEGRDKNLKAAHFIAFGARLGVRPAAIEQMLRGLAKKVGRCIPQLEQIGLEPKKRQQLERVIGERLSELTP